MTQTVLGFFDSAEAARQAEWQLQQAGIPAGRIDISLSGTNWGLAAIRRFLQRLFADRSAPNAYFPPVYAAAAVLSVQTDTAEQALNTAEELKQAGARSLDRPNAARKNSPFWRHSKKAEHPGMDSARP